MINVGDKLDKIASMILSNDDNMCLLAINLIKVDNIDFEDVNLHLRHDVLKKVEHAILMLIDSKMIEIQDELFKSDTIKILDNYSIEICKIIDEKVIYHDLWMWNDTNLRIRSTYINRHIINITSIIINHIMSKLFELSIKQI